MLLTLTTTYHPATDLGYLLGKHPARVQAFELSFGKAHVFYPEASEERCTAALLLEVDPVGLVRSKSGAGALDQYVNDRPYVTSSFLSVAIAQVFTSALSGKSKEHAALAETAIPLEATLAVVPCAGGEAVLRKLFEPLGYTLTLQQHALDEQFPDWGASRYFTLTLQNIVRLQDLLAHLYVLIPVLDGDKHYYVGDDEVAKLMKHGEGWLATHPARELIASRYLKRRHSLVRAALNQLISEATTSDAEAESVEAPITAETATDGAAKAISNTPAPTDVASREAYLSLHQQRLGATLAMLKQCSARRVLDLGCGEGKLIELLLKDRQFEEIIGLDVSYRTLEITQEKLHLDRLAPAQATRVKLLHGALTYRDERLHGYDAAAVVEVIEHLDPPRLAAFERMLFEFARPRTVILTTPNVEYNVKYGSLRHGLFRHQDHRFEWTRAEFQTWANHVAQRFGYAVRFLPIGPEDEAVGAPSQMGVFSIA